jgi:hypothetical protein
MAESLYESRFFSEKELKDILKKIKKKRGQRARLEKITCSNKNPESNSRFLFIKYNQTLMYFHMTISTEKHTLVDFRFDCLPGLS